MNSFSDVTLVKKHIRLGHAGIVDLSDLSIPDEITLFKRNGQKE